MLRSVEISTPQETARAPLSALFRQIADDATLLARTEVKLARAEVAENVGKLARPVVMIVAAALLGIAVLFTLMGAAVAALTPLVGPAWAALIVAAVVGLIAYLLLQAGLSGFKSIDLAPKRAVASVKADAAAAKDIVS